MRAGRPRSPRSPTYTAPSARRSSSCTRTTTPRTWYSRSRPCCQESLDHLDALRAKCVAEEVLSRIQSPVGLDIGAQTPGEIALSVLAGIVASRRANRIRKRDT